MKPLKMNFTSRLRECCDRLSPRQRKAVVLGMILLMLGGCLLSMLRGVDRLIEGSQPRQPVITLDSLGRMAPVDAMSDPVIPEGDERTDK
ncbi:MAG: TraL conjugative transposon family protein [Alistipes indistinctus]|jgi:hypothetical protein|uniref:TraL conjugative transposon family protein n=1 Tax=Alistipes indistinctus TaxID=626932 RepID=UPI0032C18187